MSIALYPSTTFTFPSPAPAMGWVRVHAPRVAGEGDHYVYYGANVPTAFILHRASSAIHERVEHPFHAFAEAGERYLVHQSRVVINEHTLIIEYISTRVRHMTEYNGWIRQSVVYAEGEESPYAYHYDPIHPEGESPAALDLLSH